MTTATATAGSRRMRLPAIIRDNAWNSGLVAFLLFLLVFTLIINPRYDAGSLQGLATSVLPLALAAVAQAVIVIGGGIDLSISSQMALVSVITATMMAGQSEEMGVAIVILGLLVGLLLGAVNGALVVLTKVPDIIVTLATYFVWAGCALLVTPRPAGASAIWLKQLVVGPFLLPFIPKAAIVLIVTVALIWIPLRRSRYGLQLYAVGSNRLAAFRSGVSVGRTKFIAYVIGGLFAAFAGVSLTGSTTIGTPVPDASYVLIAIAAIVLGGVSLAGGVGGVFGPIVAIFVLQLIRTDMTFLSINSNYALVAQGLILIGVLMAGSFITIRRARA